MTSFKLAAFTILSGIGWCIDFGIFNYLVSANVLSIYANMISASIAVLFVLLTARRWVFRHHVGTLQIVIVKYVVWNIIAITAVSYLLGLIASGLAGFDLRGLTNFIWSSSRFFISEHTLTANIAKIMVTPVTMYANFVAMGYIVERRFSFL